VSVTLQKIFRLIPLLVTLSLSSCSRPSFSNFNQLGGLRILTIEALSNQSEVNPGTTVTLQPVVSDLNAGGRTINVTIKACVDPGVDIGADPECINPDITSTSSFSTTTLSSNGTYTGEAPTFTVTVPAAPANYVNAPAYEQYNGVSYLIIYSLQASDGSTVTAFKRIMVSSPGKIAKNLNPNFASIAGNGVPLGTNNVYNAATLKLVPSFQNAPETYQVMNLDGSFSTQIETLTTTWFITDGSMQYQRTTNGDSNQWQPEKPLTRGATMVVVSHDGRAGESYMILNFN